MCGSPTGSDAAYHSVALGKLTMINFRWILPLSPLVHPCAAKRYFPVFLSVNSRITGDQVCERCGTLGSRVFTLPGGLGKPDSGTTSVAV